jgi:hypothetical protein
MRRTNATKNVSLPIKTSDSSSKIVFRASTLVYPGSLDKSDKEEKCNSEGSSWQLTTSRVEGSRLLVQLHTP